MNRVVGHRGNGVLFVSDVVLQPLLGAIASSESLAA